VKRLSLLEHVGPELSGTFDSLDYALTALANQMNLDIPRIGPDAFRPVTRSPNVEKGGTHLSTFAHCKQSALIPITDIQHLQSASTGQPRELDARFLTRAKYSLKQKFSLLPRH